MAPIITVSLRFSSLYTPIMSEFASSNGSHRAKTVLFCVVCGHESPADGDWNESTTTESESDPDLILSCPECEATVTRRPMRESARFTAPVADD